MNLTWKFSFQVLIDICNAIYIVYIWMDQTLTYQAETKEMGKMKRVAMA